MNLFCCQEVSDYPSHEELYNPRTSNYKLKTYSSQSTDTHTHTHTNEMPIRNKLKNV